MFNNKRIFSLSISIVIFVAGCGMPGVVANGVSLPAARPTATSPALPPLQLPRDESPHHNLTEWWYYTGHASGTDASGNIHAYGFELTFFQAVRGLIPPTYIGHFAITDLNRKEFHYDQLLQIEPDALAQAATVPGFSLNIDAWHMQGFNGADHLQAQQTNYAIDFTLTSQKPAALHNNGLFTYGVTGYSYYYSRTHMLLKGSIVDHGTTIPVAGLGWMDHQWGDFITVGGTGWDWFSIQLSNTVDYMIYLIRDAQGNPISYFGSRVDAQGITTEIPSAAITEAATAYWISPHTHIRYPSGWTLGLPDGTFTVTPLLQDQELNTTPTTGNIYWEGACAISGTIAGKPVTGEGYTELTGYH